MAEMRDKYARSHGEVGVAVCKALNLDPSRVRALTLRLRPDKLVSVTVEITPSHDEMMELAAELRQQGLEVSEEDMTALSDKYRRVGLVRKAV